MKLAFELSEKLVMNSSAAQPNKRLASMRLYAELLASVKDSTLLSKGSAKLCRKLI